MLERDVERYLKRRVESLGGITWKIGFIGQRGCPDRLVVLNGDVWLIELKAKTGVLSPLQVRTLGLMRKHGMKVAVLWSLGDIDKWLHAEAYE